MKHTILIIEDETELATILGAYFEVEGFEVKIAEDGEMGWQLFQKEKISLALLDIMLPKRDGLTLCKQIREQSDIPIIMISAKSGEMDKVIALGVGADDYVTKPFSPLELVARVKAQLRRYDKALEKSTAKTESLYIGKLELNKQAYTVSVGEEKITFTTKEFEVLYYLASHPEQVFSKEQIYQGVWGYSQYAEDNSVTVYIKRIREKLSKYQLDYIKTVWGAGYKVSVE